MTTIPRMRDALESRLAALDGLAVAQEWGDQINVSANRSVAVVEKAPTQYDAAQGGQADWVGFVVHVITGKVSDRVARDKLDEFCDPTRNSTTSIRTAVNGGFGDGFFRTVSDTGYQEYDVAGGGWLGCGFTVQVLT